MRDTEGICYDDLGNLEKKVKWRSAALEPLGRVQIAARAGGAPRDHRESGDEPWAASMTTGLCSMVRLLFARSLEARANWPIQRRPDCRANVSMGTKNAGIHMDA
jgi:hypothetical protein